MNIIRRAFTLVELLVVIAIFTLLLAIGVPAFSSMLYSSEQSLAENALRVALSAARDAASRSPRGQDAAAVFFYDPTVGRMNIQAYISAGVLKDQDPGTDVVVAREVFVPVSGYEPTQLPRGWMVRGYAPGGTIDDQWYEKTYTGSGARSRGNWVFPETAFYNDEVGNDGLDRQTFMVRFEGGTGIVKTSSGEAVLVYAPSVTTQFRRSSSPWSIPSMRADLEADPQRLVRRVLTRPAAGAGSLTLVQRQLLLGNISGDTILTKPIGQLAVYNENRLAGYLGVRLDRTTNCMYQDTMAMSPGSREPTLVAGPGGGVFNDAVKVRLNDWIQAFDSTANPTDPPLDSDCRIFTVQRYLGWLQEITGTRGGQGVGS